MKLQTKIVAIVLALVGSVASTLVAADYPQEESTRDITRLVAELAEHTARLEQLQSSMNRTDKESDLGSKHGTTTVRWLTQPVAQEEFIVSDEAAAVAPMVTNVTQTSAVAPSQGASLAFEPETSASGNRIRSKIIRAQANEGIYKIPESQPEMSSVEDAPNPASSEPAWGEPVYCGADSCCDTCCDACTQGCCDSSCCGGACGCSPCQRRPCTIVAGTEVLFLAPDINGHRVNWRHDQFAPTPAFNQQFGPLWDNADLDDFYVAPRIWLGVQGCKWGLLGRYFHLRAGENDFRPFDPLGTPPSYSFNANSIFEAYYTDLLVTRNFCLHGCKNQLQFGARYAAIEHHESIYGRVVVDNDTLSDAILDASARSNRRAHGTGLTFGLNGRKPLFCNSCAHWFYSAQSSILWGCTHLDVETDAAVVLADPSATAIAGSIDGARTAIDDDLFIGEIQAGIQWDFALRCLPAKAFFRTAFEYQYWDASSGFAAAGSFAGVQTTGGIPTDNQVSATASAPGIIVDLYGVSVATGFTW